MAQVISNLPPNNEPVRFVDVVQRQDGKNALVVDASIGVTITSDIQIGAVEIKDYLSNARVNVIDAGDYNAMLIQDVDEAQKTPICIYDSQAISTTGTLTVGTRTVPSGKIFIWKGVIFTGEDIGKFEILVNTTPKGIWRNSGSEPAATITFPEPLKLTAGQIANVKVTNLSGKTKTYFVTILGYDKSV